ncbi:MAG: AAA family ATPase [Sphaerochaeta sp.]
MWENYTHVADNPLLDAVDTFIKHGGTHIFLDEVHTYPDWTIAIKNLYDEFPTLHIVFTGSSLLELERGKADLSRRALMYELPELSFREYLEIGTKMSFPAFSITDLLDKHGQIVQEIVSRVKPFRYFSDYLQFGYYPYYLEGAGDRGCIYCF